MASTGHDGWSEVDRLGKDQTREMMKDLVQRQEALHDDVLRRVAAERRAPKVPQSNQRREGAPCVSYRGLQHSFGGEVKEGQQTGTPLTGPWPVVMQGEHVCLVMDLVTGQRLQVDVARIRPYVNASFLDARKELKDVIANLGRAAAHGGYDK